MGKSQAALFVAGMLAGATGSGVLVAASRGSAEISVTSIKGVTGQAPDGGTQLEVETCGVVDKHDGSRASRWCDRRTDPHMDALAAIAIDRVVSAQHKGEDKLAKFEADKGARVARAKAEAEARKAARLDAGAPPPPPP